MDDSYMKDEGNSLRVQKHQLNESQDKLSEINDILLSINDEQISNDNDLDKMLDDISNLLEENNDLASVDEVTEYKLLIENELDINSNIESVILVEEVQHIELTDNTSWEDYIGLVNDYGEKNNLDLEDDPFKHLMTKSQQVALQRRIKDDFTLKKANCDKYDYMIAGTCGVIGGLIDILFVGTPGNSALGTFTDNQANKVTEKFAEFVGWDKNKALEKGSNSTASAIGFLERKYKVNYDQATTHSTGGMVDNLSLKNHHLKSLGHSPDLIGLFFSILNQFTSTSSFVSNGKLITMDTDSFELKGSDFVSKFFCGFSNWFGHIMSDWSGSSGTIGKGGRGTGVPIPFYNLFQLMDFGSFGQHKQSFATITTKVFEGGYDLRHGIAMSIPVVTTELLVRLMYTMKSRFYHGRSWKESVPNGNIPELRRMLLVGHGSLCLIDGADAFIRSGGEIVAFLSRTNLLAWVRFGHLGLKELNAWYNEGHIDVGAVDKYLEKEYKYMVAT